MIRRLSLAVGLALLSAGGLHAAVSGVTVGTSPAQVLAAPTTRGYRLVIIANQSGTATISCAPGSASPAIGSAGSFDIPPGQKQTWAAANVVFATAWYCVASASSTPVTIEAE
jgi:hypothetical protein